MYNIYTSLSSFEDTKKQMMFNIICFLQHKMVSLPAVRKYENVKIVKFQKHIWVNIV